MPKPENTDVHGLSERESTEVNGVRLPTYLWRMVEAVQARDNDRWRNDTIRKAVEAYVRTRLDKAA